MKSWMVAFTVIFLQCFSESINPPFLQNQIIKDSTLIGTWLIGIVDSLDGIVNVNILDTTSYLIACKDFSHGNKDTTKFKFKGKVTIIDSQIILSLTFSPDDIKDTNYLTQSLHIPGYFFVRLIKLSKDSLKADVFDGEKLLDELKKSISLINYSSFGNRALITDSPIKVRKFLSKCLKKKDLFYKNSIILWRAQG